MESAEQCGDAVEPQWLGNIALGRDIEPGLRFTAIGAESIIGRRRAYDRLSMVK